MHCVHNSPLREPAANSALSCRIKNTFRLENSPARAPEKLQPSQTAFNVDAAHVCVFVNHSLKKYIPIPKPRNTRVQLFQDNLRRCVTAVHALHGTSPPTGIAHTYVQKVSWRRRRAAHHRRRPASDLSHSRGLMFKPKGRAPSNVFIHLHKHHLSCRRRHPSAAKV